MKVVTMLEPDITALRFAVASVSLQNVMKHGHDGHRSTPTVVQGIGRLQVHWCSPALETCTTARANLRVDVKTVQVPKRGEEHEDHEACEGKDSCTSVGRL